jgi:hypothetical protein
MRRGSQGHERKEGWVIRFLPSPRKAPGTRGHNPDNQYAAWRSPMRDARREVGWPSGRQWVKFRKFGSKAYRKHLASGAGGAINES